MSNHKSTNYAALALEEAVAKSLRTLDVRAECKPLAPADGFDVLGVSALAAIKGAACGELLATSLGGDRDMVGGGRALGGFAGLLFAAWLLEHGWRLRGPSMY